MKKSILFIVIFLLCSAIFAQQKYALVIGNANYKDIPSLKNPVNDANDMEAALKSLGFDVTKILNGNLDKMEEGIGNLKRSLSASNNSYGLFYYAGHGVQSNGENYLIPLDANIQSENHLRQRAVSVQFVLDELNDAKNEFNAIILDACRDNPFSWNRSTSRGLSAINRQPTGSIIMYATAAGQIASDGEGRNGIFTQYLLINLKTPELDVNEVFRRTMAAVERATGNTQRPTILNQYSGQAYFGSKPSTLPASANNGYYNVGDTGPAGGIIFYKKAARSDGWQYLEVAPVETEFNNIEWGAYNTDVSGTLRDLGKGKSNTQIITNFLRRNNQSGAALMCTQLNYGGYNDWYLPSIEELRWLYQNLWKDKKLGDFKGTRYWSSTQFNESDVWYFVFNFVFSLNGGAGRESHSYTKQDKLSVRAVRAF
jgi:hypothetical protein